ncbi:MAG: carbohydrate ABC transporter permease [Clostridiales bacterium]|jgi:raffinose/stachyose/melibiose transport system permease protein|nr:carbohydrate ABC transporter permease [Clostridiales bacterium]
MKRRLQLSRLGGELMLLLATLVMLIPIYYFVIGAFKPRLDIVKFPLVITPEMFTTGNFTYAIKKMKIVSSLTNTGLITLTSLAILVVGASLAGFAIARVQHRFFKYYYATVIALMVIPFIGALIPIVVLIRRLNMIGSLWACVLIQAAWNMPFSVFLYTGFMRALPSELEEAAYIDGCSMFRVYFNIFLPLLTPVTATCLIRCGIGIWNDYLVSASLLNSVRQPTLMVAVYSFFGQYVSEYGYAFAGIIMASLPVVVMFLFLQKYFIKGITAGAVKG